MCQLTDIQLWEDVTHFFAIDDCGEAIFEADRTDGDFRCYHCDWCKEQFDSFDEVKQHIKEQK